jgi:hypothetical protein
MRRLLVLALVLSVLLIAAPVTAQTTWYVDDDTCPAAGDGSAGNPFCKIHDAINAAASGDTIDVAAGTYDEYLVIQKSVHLIGEDKDTTIVTYSGTSTVEQLVMLGWNTGGTLAGGATVQGFKLLADVGLDGDKDLIKLRANGASGAPIVIRDNVFQGDGSTRYLGIETAYDAGHVIVENNEFHDLAYGAWFNVLMHAEIKGNTMTDAILTALALCTSDIDKIHDVEIADNTILRSTTYPSPPASWGPWLSGMHIGSTVYNMNITGNTIADGNYHSIVIHDRGTTDLSNVHINCNNMDNNPDGFVNEVTVAVDAVYNWWGDATGPSGQGTGSGDPVSASVDFDPWMITPVDGACPPPLDDEGPITSDVVADPNPVAVGGDVHVTATVDDTTTGGSDIASANYTVYDSAHSEVLSGNMSNSFDSPTVDVWADFTAPGDVGIYDLCVSGTDAAANTGPEECVMLVVYDPDGGFVTGGGWMMSPPGAYMAPPYFVQTFDTDPPLSNSAVDGAWYPDRYPPAAFESAIFDGDNRLHVFVDGDDQYPHGEHTTFYNFQGRKFNLWYDLDTHIMADLYMGEDWETEDRHASLWATTYDADGVISGYPIVGFTSGTGFRIFSQDTDQNTSNGYQSGWYDIGFPEGFEYGRWYSFQAALTESAYHYYIDGDLVWTDVVTFDSVLWANMMLQAYNYGEDYDVYWDNVGAGPMGPTGKASFGFVSKYKKGASEPTGNTEFQFKAADLNFHSTSYDWLVVTGKDFAKFKGSGTINGDNAPNDMPYKFQLWAGDGDPDTFRIRIWWEENGTEHVVYDNGMNQPIGGGSIVIHKK